ncbi:polysaccharide biosynthesis protein [Clostridium carboxidivorans P7]|uniref:Polysaccharide biosynthesis protein n=1 Tax=Clostridium carboxidivorans P7 TaxID=536227 RepID=C6PS01_9CLOT|nr:oligosaccharide flippase family protein [Clostridium carboxidivorans]AKN31947.1 polysaccharide biosynthesis protein [Clostridium carboxidivorans P7]EET87926.1 polysaccharide biosynthesis protein [Clostridium carboxidivorans P7]EFG87923.1 polysaccharide biosynthesis protein [Clostridium carboxidivorans P7]
MSKSRTKLFLENFFVYGLGSILAKIAPLIMLPIITRLMPNTTYYGLSDLSNITVTFGSAIAIMGMYDAMFRMFFEKDDFEYKKEVCASALNFVLINGIIICLVFFIFKSYFSVWIFNDEKYVSLLNLTAFSILITTLSGIVVAPTRMQNKRKIFLFTNTVSPIIGYAVSIPMLMHKNYLYALPTAALVTSSIMLVFLYILNRNWFNFRKINIPLIKEMLKIGAPLMPAFIIYWIFTSCDRLMISKQIGNSFVGIYGIGARVASVSQFIYIAFAGGWQYFAFSTMKDEDQVEMTSKIFEYLALVAFSIFVSIVPFTHFVFKLFFKENYVNGYVAFPYLFLSPLLLMLYQTIVNQFLVVKNTWPSTLILLAGAVTNVVLNYFLIYAIGIEGAAIATLVGYAVSVVIACMVLSKMKLVYVSNRMKIMSILTTIFIILWRLVSPIKIIPALLIAMPTLLIFYYLYRVDIGIAYEKGKKLLKT